MSFRPAPTDINGLVRPPQLLDCIGEKCPIVQKKGYCFTDEHHLYWPNEKFMTSGSLVREFCLDRHNRIAMARCRHNSEISRAMHTKYDGAYIPPEDVMVTFLDESELLFDLGVTVKNMARIVRSLLTENSKEKASYPERSINWLQKYNEDLTHLSKRANNFDFIPSFILNKTLTVQNAQLEEVRASGLLAPPQLVNELAS